MALTDAIKHAPRWAWVTAAGVGLGAAGIKLWNGRAKDASTPADATTIGDPSAPYPVANGSTTPAGIIVPPVIVGQQGTDQQFGLQDLHNLYISATQGLIEGYQQLWGPVMSEQMALLDGNAATIQSLALAGSAPNSGATPGQPALPAAISPIPPTPAQTPIPLGTIAAAIAAVPWGGHATSAPGSCNGEFPYRNAANGKCYKVACANGNGARRKGRWHLYKDGSEVWMSTAC